MMKYPCYEFDKQLVACVPSERQLKHQQMEFYGFVHFTVNTFTGKEWGDGTEAESVFNPLAFNAEQWVEAAKAAGMRGLILTAKHHDGFCLWQTKTTEHCVRNSPFREGKGDVVKEVADACARGGIRFGVYLSPWDRNAPCYGSGKEYDDFYCEQLTELLTGYGELFSVWFDGACGEGPNGKKQVYDWERYYALIRQYQPNACISVSGPDVRWCGNEAGKTRISEWSVLPTGFDEAEAVAEKSQKAANAPVKAVNEQNEDLGSRDFLSGAAGLMWKHAEVDVSIRPGWFYHSSENLRLMSYNRLVDTYIRSVGGNCTLLLNIPADTNGLFHQGDVTRLKQLGKYIRETFAVNLLDSAMLYADSDDGVHTVQNVRKDTYDTYFATADGRNTAVITMEFAASTKVKMLEIKENLLFSQRIERFTVECQYGKSWKKIYEGTTAGYRKLCRFRPVVTNALRLTIADSRVCPVISYLAVY